MPPAEAFGVASFYALFSLQPQPQTVVHVCDDIACATRGAGAACKELAARFGPPGAPCVGGAATWKHSPCLGLCDRAPAAMVQVAGQDGCEYTLAPANSAELNGALAGERVTARFPGATAPQRADTHAHVPLLDAIGAAGVDLDGYLRSGGYAALRRALDIGPDAVIAEIAAAKLTGRGGAAFPASIKWRAVADAPARPRYIVCNADESEPGTFKDRAILEDAPFAVIESMTIAAYACGAEHGYIYVRGEYAEAAALLEAAAAEARERNLLGEGILRAGHSFDVEIRRGAGAYICGEETAMLNSIEGLRGEPRNKPPFPTEVGLFGKPTLINNVETFVNVLRIVREGAEAYSRLGTPASTGTRLFCLSGCVERPGVYEVAYGCTLRELIALAGGVLAGRPLQAVLLGGAAGVFVRPDELDIPLTVEGARAARATLGSGVVMLFDDRVNMRSVLLRIAAFFRDESCGQCVPCRVGTVRQEEALNRLMLGAEGQEEQIRLLSELDAVMRDASICGLGQTAGSAIASAIERLGVFERS